MSNLRILLTISLLALAACQPMAPQVGPDGQPLPVAYTINASEARAIPSRVVGQVNHLRANIGAGPLMQNPQLEAAAVAHARDMSAQNRAWHFGSDGSSPLDRVRAAGFSGSLIGENISETYENDIATLNAWMQTRETRDILMDPRANQLGVGWYQEPAGKIWWVLIAGS